MAPGDRGYNGKSGEHHLRLFFYYNWIFTAPEKRASFLPEPIVGMLISTIR
jgi:hypothetical protein